MLTNSAARYHVQNELERALKNAGMADGVEAGEHPARAKPLFWHTVVTTEAGKERNLYLIYDIIDSAAIGHADNEVISREVAFSIRVWSDVDFDSAKLRRFISGIETALGAAGFSVSFDREAFDINNKYCQPLRVWKVMED